MNYTELVKPFDSPAKTILIVDDEESIRKTLKYILSKIGYEVKTAEHARVAYEILNNHSIDLVISDIIMPDITGIELVEHIKKQYRPPEILLITGDPSLETATSAVKLGVFDYISKPIKKSTLLNVVHQALEKKALLDEKERLEQQNQRYLHDLEQKLDQRTYRLLLTEERYRNLFENMSVGVGISNLAGNVLEVNSTMCSITGYSPDEFKKISLANTLVDSNAKQKILDELNSSGTLDNYEVELYRANGSTYWASISAIKIMYRTQTAFLTTQIDISARKKYEFSLKRALADKEEMLREIHHRTKNNMNVIISLLNMQSYASDDEHITDILKKS